MSAEAKNLEVISKAIDQHNSSCDWPAVAVEMNPFEVDRLGWDSIRGLPIRPNPDLGTGSFRAQPGMRTRSSKDRGASGVMVSVTRPFHG